MHQNKHVACVLCANSAVNYYANYLYNIILLFCSWEYNGTREEFIRNLDGILQSDFHLKLLFDNTKYILDHSIWDCNGHFDHWFSNAKAFLFDIWNLQTLSFRFI